MRRKTLYSALYTAFVAVTLVACNDYDAAQTAYEDTTENDVTVTPPIIESSIIKICQWSIYMRNYLDKMN